MIIGDNATDLISGAAKLSSSLRLVHTYSYKSLDMFHVRSVADVLKLAVKECMKIAEGPVKKIAAVLNSLRASVKRKGEFSAVGK